MSGESAQLRDICRITQGGRRGLSGNDFVPQGYPAYGAGGMNGFLPNYEFDEPAVVLSAIGARCGKCFYTEGKWHSLANTQLLFPDPTRVDPKFLWYQLNDERRWHRSGTGQPFIKPSDVKTHRVFLPPLPEQRRIAEILDKADALRAKRRAALAQLDTLTQSIFLDMFGDPATNPRGWPVKRIEDAAQIVSGATPRTDAEEFWDGDVNWVTPKELSGLEGIYIGATERRITEAGLRSCAASVLPVGSVLFSSRAPIGHTAICSAPMATNQGFKSFILLEGTLNAHFLLVWLRLRRAYLEGLGTGATFKEVSKAVVARIELAVPPFDLQASFADIVIGIERLRTGQRQARTEGDKFFASLQSRAFRGEL